uniref:Uncharacterized protein n=1 Tax=Siphoviridae sp. ctRNB7 TaxID=2825502 RepID=A0A8S5PW94_9CAUD|nr:MAG TPA: hypothetical protein [Siphoviridae sp. ctRNB7]
MQKYNKNSYLKICFITILVISLQRENETLLLTLQK